MINENLRTVIYDRIQKAALGIENGTLWISNGKWNLCVKQDKMDEIATHLCVGTDADLSDSGIDGKLLIQWPSHADEFFGESGKLSQHLDGYEPRLEQLQAARLFETGLRMGDTVLIEAGTGTGKSFIPMGICAAMGKKLVVSTSNKALQMQYAQKDGPFLQTIYPELKVAVSVGKSNYICNKKMAAGCGDANLKSWHATTATGSVEEITLHVNGIYDYTVGDDCDKRSCGYLESCFYYAAKEKLKEADITISNHAYTCMDEIIPMANLLPPHQVKVFDECHQLPNYARNALGTVINQKSLNRQADKALSVGADANLSGPISDFMQEIAGYKVESDDREIGINVKDEFSTGLQLAMLFKEAAVEVWDEGDVPGCAEETYLQKISRGLRRTADSLESVSSTSASGYTRWIGDDRQSITFCPFDVSKFIGSMAGFTSYQPYAADPHKCAYCGTPHDSKTIHVLHDRGYCANCIATVDYLDESETMATMDWLRMDHSKDPIVTKERRATLFMSATMATPTMSHFKKECGIPYALELIVDSPFDYQKNALIYAPNGQSPEPSNSKYSEWLSNQLADLGLAAGGSCLYLFTAYKEMKRQYEALQSVLMRRGYNLMIQGELPKMALLDQFKNNDKAILFATKSFWEGVDLPGDDLKITVMNKIPFPALSPLFQARSAHIERNGGESFFDLSLPEAILDLKQGSGRTIRTQNDKGVIVITDARLHSKSYGKKIIQSLPNAPITTDIEDVFEFFTPMGA